MQKLDIIILIVYLSKFSSCQSVVETNSGYVQSVAAQLDDVEAFLGVPYAEPPIGDLRFAKPVPKQPWTKIYDAARLPPPCAQHSLDLLYYFYRDVSDMSEDCLYLNIWTPKAKPRGYLRPVIIYIHHGSFVLGSSNQKEFDGSHLASEGDMIVVTINYRLGPFGFFLAHIEEADGNMGMYDQLMAMEWVKTNAKYFGGDPENIVLMGTSAGAMSVSAHIISPLSRNLIRRAIIMSGTLLNPMYENGNEELLKNSEHVASIAGCTNKSVTLRTDPRSVVECLKSRPTEIFVEAQSRLARTSPVPFHPRMGDRFLPEGLSSAYREGKFRSDIDVMFGSTKDEGSLFLLLVLNLYVGQYGKTPVRMSKSLANSMLRVAISSTKTKIKPEKILSVYRNSVENPTPEGYLKMAGKAVADFALSCPSVFVADFLSLKGNRVYFYKFGFRAASTPMAEWIGTTHLDDIQYIFGNPYHENFTADEAQLSKRLIARLSAFAKTGNPNVPGQLPWLQYSYHNPLYLYIGQDEESVQLKPWNRCEIWRKDFKSEIDLGSFLQNSTFSSGVARSKTDFSICLLACLSLILSYGLGPLIHYP